VKVQQLKNCIIKHSKD